MQKVQLHSPPSGVQSIHWNHSRQQRGRDAVVHYQHAWGATLWWRKAMGWQMSWLGNIQRFHVSFLRSIASRCHVVERRKLRLKLSMQTFWPLLVRRKWLSSLYGNFQNSRISVFHIDQENPIQKPVSLKSLFSHILFLWSYRCWFEDIDSVKTFSIQSLLAKLQSLKDPIYTT